MQSRGESPMTPLPSTSVPKMKLGRLPLESGNWTSVPGSGALRRTPPYPISYAPSPEPVGPLVGQPSSKTAWYVLVTPLSLYEYVFAYLWPVALGGAMPGMMYV